MYTLINVIFCFTLIYNVYIVALLRQRKGTEPTVAAVPSNGNETNNAFPEKLLPPTVENEDTGRVKEQTIDAQLLQTVNPMVEGEDNSLCKKTVFRGLGGDEQRSIPTSFKL
jgi:hypothetical protein